MPLLIVCWKLILICISQITFVKQGIKWKTKNTTLSEHCQNTTLSEHCQNTTLSEHCENTTLSEHCQNTTMSEHFQNQIEKLKLEFDI